MRVVIDPGHGGTDPGAIGAAGTLEKDINLALANILRNIMGRHDLEVYMTREGDRTMSINERFIFIAKCKPDLMISVHHNAGGVTSTGSEALYRASGTPMPGETTLAKALAEAMAATLGIPNRGLKPHVHGVLKSDCDSVTLEAGFLTNPAEEQLLLRPEVQRGLAEEITYTVLHHYRLPAIMPAPAPAPSPVQHWAQGSLDKAIAAGIIATPEAWADLDTTLSKGLFLAFMDKAGVISGKE